MLGIVGTANFFFSTGRRGCWMMMMMMAVVLKREGIDWYYVY